MIKVLFNDSCKICSKEISHYKSLKPDQIMWVDINDITLSTKMSGKSHRELLRRLHVIKDGSIYSGVRAFVIMWDKIPKYRWIAKLVATPGVYHISIVIYEIIAFALFLKNRHQLYEKE